LCRWSSTAANLAVERAGAMIVRGARLELIVALLAARASPQARAGRFGLDLQPARACAFRAHGALLGACHTHPRSCALQHKIEFALIIGLFSPSQAFEGKQSHFTRDGRDTCLRRGHDVCS
jgi:hypothetical protein